MCKFCQRNEALVILETKLSVIIANYFPLGKISLLAIPKRHVASLTELSPEELHDLIDLVALASNKIKAVAEPEGLNIFLNEGKIAGQSIEHLHFHIVARYLDDGLENFRRNGDRIPISREELHALKELF